MIIYGSILFVALIIAISILLYHKHKVNKRKKKELKEKLILEQKVAQSKFQTFFNINKDNILKANHDFVRYLDFKSGYFSNFKLTSWKNQYSIIFKEMNLLPINKIYFLDEEDKIIKDFTKYYNNSETLRTNFNNSFIVSELGNYSNLFDNIEGKKLDLQQRTAIVTDDDNNLVIAGAGSGKTTTIVGKVKYIVDRYKIAPEEILLISFTNKSASTLSERIGINGVEVKTFHKFGKDIIAETEGHQPSIFDVDQFKPLIIRHFQELIQNPAYLQFVTNFFIDYLKPVKSQFDFQNHGDYIQYIKDQNFRTYKHKRISNNRRTTYKMEVVKSIEECKIANFLFFNGLEYEYEFPYEYETGDDLYSQYKPDFTVKQNNKTIYIEHFAISRSGDVPVFFTKNQENYKNARIRYWAKIEWARNLHRDNNTILVETYSYEMSEGILFENLERQLKDAGVKLSPKTPDEIWKIINDNAKEEVDSFITLFCTFINLMKSNNYTLVDLSHKIIQAKDEIFKKRVKLFLDIIEPIFKNYETVLKQRKEIDFNDMINKAAHYINQKVCKRYFKYIIIDEFQDISIARYQLIAALKVISPLCKLFCVGDDWQSIFRFTGSDIALFKEFEKYFGFTVRSKIETTYRFNNPLIELSSAFIQKNPNQSKKELKGVSSTEKTYYKICISNNENQDDTEILQKLFDKLIDSVRNIDKVKIFILSRYSFDFDNRIKNENEIFRIDKINKFLTYEKEKEMVGKITIKAQFLTIHKSKGLEADLVIILNCNSGKYGFPSEMSDDPILNLLLSEADQFENGEERRLFYVAMTRARKFTFFITDSAYKSKFINELIMQDKDLNKIKCPECKTGDIVFRKSGVSINGDNYQFYGCSNYLYGCEFSKNIFKKSDQ